MRKGLDDTWRQLEAEGDGPPRHPDGRPLIPGRMPSDDDGEPLGLSYHKTDLTDADRGGLTMPRTFFGRSGFTRVRFADSDLTESRMCWNDFVECDFGQAVLAGCDLRASIFRRCRFAGADLCRADLRRTTFEDCDFAGADLGAALVGAESGCRLRDSLTREQRADLEWVEDEGPEPPGG
jgi:uncharacterized protein YjbI with pentapeptide repeats